MGKGRNKRELKMKLLFLSFLGLSMAGTKCSGDMCWARGPRPRKPQGGKNEAECSIDAHETNPESWNMNCPDSCEIMEFLDVVEKRIAEEWAMVKSNFEINVDKSGMGNNRREILEILLIKLNRSKSPPSLRNAAQIFTLSSFLSKSS